MKKKYSAFFSIIFFCVCNIANGQAPSFQLNSAISYTNPITIGSYETVSATVKNIATSGTFDFECDLVNTSNGFITVIGKICNRTVNNNSTTNLLFNSGSTDANPINPPDGSGTYRIHIIVSKISGVCPACGTKPVSCISSVVAGNYTNPVTVTVSQACTNWSINPSSQNGIPFSGGNYSTTVFASGNACTYNLTFNNSWLHFISYGAGFFNYSVDANPGGARTGTISINDINDGISGIATLTVNQNAQSGASPIINVNGNLSFGNVQVGTSSQSTMTIFNTGNAPLNVSSINYPTGFIGNWNNGSITAGGSQQVIVTFTPNSSTTYGGTIQVFSNTSGGTSTISCSGTGTSSAVPTINITGNLSFGNVQVGTSSQSTMTIFNTGNATLNVSSIVYPTGFNINWTNGSITAGGSQPVIVTFTPTSSITYGGTIQVFSNTSGGTSTISCSGTGINSTNYITGTVYDYSGTNANASPLSGASVELLNSTSGFINGVTTTSNGSFQFPNLSSSNYQVHSSKGSGGSLVNGTITGVNPGANLSIVKLPYSLHQQAVNANTNIGTHQFDYSLGYIITYPHSEPAFNTSLGLNYLQSSLSLFNSSIDAKIEALQRLLSLTNTIKIVGDKGAEIMQETIKEIINGVMMAFSMGEFIHKFETLLANGNINWFRWAWYKLQKEVLITGIWAIKQAIDAGIAPFSNLQLGSRIKRAVDGSFEYILDRLNADNNFTDANLEHILTELIAIYYTPLIYQQNFITPIQNNLTPAITNIATLNYSNSTPAAISRLNSIQTSSGNSYTQNYSDLVYYSTLSEGLSSGGKIAALTRVLFLNPPGVIASQVSSVLLGLGAIWSEGKAIAAGLNGYLEQKDFANSACNTSTQRAFQNGYVMFQDSVWNDSLHILYLKADTAITAMQNEDYSLESVLNYAQIDSSINSKVISLIGRLNNQLVTVGSSTQVDSFYLYLSCATRNTNLRSNMNWLVGAKIANVPDSKINDSLSYYSAIVKANNVLADSVLNQGRIVSSTKPSPAYFTIEKIIYPSIADTGSLIPVFIITRLHSDTTLTAQLFLTNYIDTLSLITRVYQPNINDTSQILINAGAADSVLIMRVNTSCAEAIEASKTFQIHIQSKQTDISINGSTLLCFGDSAILIAHTPSGCATRWKDEISDNYVGIGDSLVIHAGFPGKYRAVYNDTLNQIYYYSHNSIEIGNSVLDIGKDKSVTLLCSTDTTDIRNVFNTTGLITQWNIANPGAVGLGNYQLIVINNVGCKDTAMVSVKQDVETWIGTISNNWHDPLNWSFNHIPNDSTHVIIGPAPYSCFISSNATAASVYVEQGGLFNIESNKNIQIKADCDSLVNPGALATVSTQPISNVSSINASGGGIVSNGGGSPILARGLCWNSNPNPTIEHRRTINGSGSGGFSSSLNGLMAETVYFVRAYVTNYAGTSYGNSISFVTPPSPIYDFDGNTYPVINICNQKWLAKNLEVTHYRNGDTIPQVQDPATWAALTTGAWCYYQNNTANGPVYGKLYNCYAVNDPRGLAPLGWHIPSNAEWTKLSDTCLGGSSVAGGKMKTTGTLQAGTGLWGGSVNTSTNTSGFSGVPAGYCFTNGTFGNISAAALWWSATQSSASNAWYREADMGIDDLSSSNYNKKLGISVRCVKD